MARMARQNAVGGCNLASADDGDEFHCVVIWVCAGITPSMAGDTPLVAAPGSGTSLQKQYQRSPTEHTRMCTLGVARNTVTLANSSVQNLVFHAMIFELFREGGAH